MINMEFITGNNFKENCNFCFDETGINRVIREPRLNEIPKYFISLETLTIESFFSQHKPNTEFIIVTHNSDKHIDNSFLEYLNDDLLIKWYGQNIDFVHPKLESIPIGIANQKWPHGDVLKINNVINQNNKKEKLVYSNFQTWTNPNERNYCLNQINNKGIINSHHTNFDVYLNELSSSFFMISPKGNGVDCHRNWEAIYCGCIPIVLDNYFTRNIYKDLPVLPRKTVQRGDVCMNNKALEVLHYDSNNIYLGTTRPNDDGEPEDHTIEFKTFML